MLILHSQRMVNKVHRCYMVVVVSSFLHWVKSWYMMLFLLSSAVVFIGCTDSTASPMVKEENNFFVAGQEIQQKQIVLLLMFHSEGCSYCIALEEDFLRPMLLNKSYQSKVLIRKIQPDSGATVVDFKDQEVAASAFAKRYGVNFTPTLLFLDANGQEVAERMIGLNTPSLFGAYIDIEIEKALKKIRAKNAS